MLRMSYLKALQPLLFWMIGDSSQTIFRPTEISVSGLNLNNSCGKGSRGSSGLRRASCNRAKVFLFPWSHGGTLQSLPCRRQLPNFHQSFGPGNSVSDVISSCTALAVPVSGSLLTTQNNNSQELGPLAASKSLKSGHQLLLRDETSPWWATCTNELPSSLLTLDSTKLLIAPWCFLQGDLQCIADHARNGEPSS